jgi:hypothetical protein
MTNITRRTIRQRHRRRPLRPRQPRRKTPLHHRQRAIRLRHLRPLHPQPRRPPIQFPRGRLRRLPHLRPPQHHPRLRVRLRPQLHNLRLLRHHRKETRRRSLQAELRLLRPRPNIRQNRQPYLRPSIPRRHHAHSPVHLPLAEQHQPQRVLRRSRLRRQQFHPLRSPRRLKIQLPTSLRPKRRKSRLMGRSLHRDRKSSKHRLRRRRRSGTAVPFSRRAVRS